MYEIGSSSSEGEVVSCPGAGRVMSGGEKCVLRRWRSDVIRGTLFAELVMNLSREDIQISLKGAEVTADSREQTFPRILPQHPHTPRHFAPRPRLSEQSRILHRPRLIHIP